jgi:hypothetical protein
MSGILVDPRSGSTLRLEEFQGAPGEPWNVSLPEGFDTLLLAMRATR